MDKEKERDDNRKTKKHYGKKHGNKTREPKLPSIPAVNSPAFWNKVNGLLAAAGRIPSTNPMGVIYDGFGQKMSSFAQAMQLMVIPWIESFGAAEGFYSDPLNTSAQQLFTAIREKISGSRPYDAADLIQYVVAVYSAHCFLAYMKMLYGCTNIVSPLNRDLARLICEGLGFSYNDILAHKADLLFYINNFAYRLSQFVVPAGMSNLEHWKLLLSGIFTDRYVDSLKNQFYVFMPCAFYRYDWANATLVLEGIGTSGKPIAALSQATYAQLITFGTSLLNALTGNTDVGIISGDILRTFEGAIEKPETISADYVIKLNVTTDEMLNQIRNMNFFNYGYFYDHVSEFDLEQTSSTTLAYSSVANTGNQPDVAFAVIDTSDSSVNTNTISLSNDKGQVLIMYEANASEDAIMVATRMMAHVDYNAIGYDQSSQGDNVLTAPLKTWGVEVFFNPSFLRMNVGSGIAGVNWTAQYYVTNDIFFTSLGDVLSCRSEFEGCPKLYRYGLTTSTPPQVGTGEDHFSLDNFLLLPEEVLDDLHYTAVQSSLYVASAAKFSR